MGANATDGEDESMNLPTNENENDGSDAAMAALQKTLAEKEAAFDALQSQANALKKDVKTLKAESKGHRKAKQRLEKEVAELAETLATDRASSARQKKDSDMLHEQLLAQIVLWCWHRLYGSASTNFMLVLAQIVFMWFCHRKYCGYGTDCWCVPHLSVGTTEIVDFVRLFVMLLK
eukprot:m.232438 g.232438  ORF g.232438 m.232438 type:complete len:176 (+) comp19275_c0_seq2:205-732(+)